MLDLWNFSLLCSNIFQLIFYILIPGEVIAV